MKKQLMTIKFLASAIITLLCLTALSKAQTTAFTYQGKLNDSSVASPTNGTYEMQFKLFTTAQTGTGMQIGDTQTVPAVQVAGGIFTVQLDAENNFNGGTDLFIEISVRPVGSQAALTTLSPRQQVTSAPYSVQSRNALTAANSDKLANLPASSYTQNNDARLSDDRNPLAGSTNYVQNQNSAPQTSTDFNISGSGTADTFNAATQFNIGGNRVLSVKGNANVFVGGSAGTANLNGNSNTFVGSFSGNANINGFNNAFFGTDSGRNNQGDANSFFGRSSGYDTTSGSSNSFFGLDAGRYNQTGSNNAFFGRIAGNKNNADNNSFFGFYAGGFTTIGGGNAFFGYQTGLGNTTGANNTLLGSGANVGANNLTFATAIGAGAVVSTSNTIVLGTSATSTEIPGTLKVATLGTTGNTTLCRNAANQIADCPAGTGSYINNATVQQANAFFNISGGGTLGGTLSANLVNSVTNYRIGGSIVLGTPNATTVVAGPLANYTLSAGNNAFFGYKAGAAANNTGQGNVFFGSEAGTTNSNGAGNSFVGRDAGFTNSSGNGNSFFGNSAGKFNTIASFNSFFGSGSGISNTTGERNSFFGFQSGQFSQTVNDNAFFGYQAGKTTTGERNTFVGSQSGITNTTGSQNTFVGYDSGSSTGSQNTVVGSDSGASGNGNTIIGYSSYLTGNFNTSLGLDNSGNGNQNTVIGYGARVDSSQFPVNRGTAIGAGAVVTSEDSVVLGTDQDSVFIPGRLGVSGSSNISTLTVQSLTATGGPIKLTVPFAPANSSTNKPLCLNNNIVVLCPSSNFSNDQNSQVEIQPLQTQTSQEQLKIQAAQIEEQQKQLRQQQIVIEGLRKIVCATNATADVCKE